MYKAIKTELSTNLVILRFNNVFLQGTRENIFKLGVRHFNFANF